MPRHQILPSTRQKCLINNGNIIPLSVSYQFSKELWESGIHVQAVQDAPGHGCNQRQRRQYLDTYYSAVAVKRERQDQRRQRTPLQVIPLIYLPHEPKGQMQHLNQQTEHSGLIVYYGVEQTKEIRSSVHKTTQVKKCNLHVFISYLIIYYHICYSFRHSVVLYLFCYYYDINKF